MLRGLVTLKRYSRYHEYHRLAAASKRSVPDCDSSESTIESSSISRSCKHILVSRAEYQCNIKKELLNISALLTTKRKLRTEDEGLDPDQILVVD